ncbi:MAG TPA: PAS domain-containing protein, partial [Stellaceae bacterium]|nr:PAS domain-containing protein [Stellaceae bacterium]
MMPLESVAKRLLILPPVDTTQILGALPDPVLVIDIDDRIVYINAAAENFFEAGAAQLLGTGL